MATLAANSQPGVTPIQALSGGLLGGIQSAQQGGRQLVQDRFQQAQMQDQQDQMQRRRQLQDLALKFAKPDGTFDMPGYQQALAQLDPQAAMELHQNELRNQLTGLETQKAQRDLNTAPTREIDVGNNKVTQEQQADGSWKTIATAGRFAPQQSAASALAQKVALLKQYGATDDDIKSSLGIGGGLSNVPAFNPNGPTGDAFIKTLPANDQPIVKAVLDGRYPIPVGKAATSPEWQRVVQLATQADPSFDAGNYPARAAARKDFTSGQTSKTITGLNTLAHHIETLDSAIDGLNNGSLQTLNAAGNFINNRLGDPRVNKFQVAANAVADEAAKVFAGSGSALADREKLASMFDPNMSPAQLKAATAQLAELVEGKLGGLQNQLDQGLGLGARNIQVASPEAKKLFNSFRSGQNTTTPASTAGWSVKRVD